MYICSELWGSSTVHRTHLIVRSELITLVMQAKAGKIHVAQYLITFVCKTKTRWLHLAT